MNTKVATNIRLEPHQLRELKKIAVEKGASLSRLFEEVITEYLERVNSLLGNDWKRDPFFKIGSRPGRSGVSHVSEGHDEELYGRGDKR